MGIRVAAVEAYRRMPCAADVCKYYSTKLIIFFIFNIFLEKNPCLPNVKMK